MLELNPQNPYLPEAEKKLDKYEKGLLFKLPAVLHLGEKIAMKVLQEGLGYLACQNISNIEIGRYIVGSMPKLWVEENIENAAKNTLDIDHDDWEYRRLMELYVLLGFKNAQTFLIARGRASSNKEIQECAADFENPNCRN